MIDSVVDLERRVQDEVSMCGWTDGFKGYVYMSSGEGNLNRDG